MERVARFGDLWCGICVCHDDPIGMCGIVSLGSINVRSNNRFEGRILDSVIGFCGHFGRIVSAEVTVKDNRRWRAGRFDLVCGCTIGSIMMGSNDVM